MNYLALNVGNSTILDNCNTFFIECNVDQFQNLKVPDNYFDIVALNLILQDIENFDYTVQKSYSILKKGAELFITLPDFALHEKCLTPSLFDEHRKHTFSLDLKKNKKIKSNHWNVFDDFCPYMIKNNFVLIDSYLDDHNYDYDKLVLSDQTLSGAKCQIVLKFKKVKGQHE